MFYKSKELENKSLKIMASKWRQFKKKRLFEILAFLEFVYRYHNLRYLKKRLKERVFVMILMNKSK